jgi:hypothetical protein
MGRRKAEWTLSAPLGGLPDRRTLEKMGESIERRERFHRERILPKRASQSYADLLQAVLEKVRGTEGVLAFQVDGGGMLGKHAAQQSGSSVLVAAGAHATRSVYVVRYERAQLHESGMVFDLTWELRGELCENPVARKELEALEREVLRRFPALKEALGLGDMEDLPTFMGFVGAVERGCLLFPVNVFGECRWVLAGTIPFPLQTPYSEKGLRGLRDEALLHLLRHEPSLGPLSHEVLAALVRGKGGPKEAARILAMARLRAL